MHVACKVLSAAPELLDSASSGPNPTFMHNDSDLESMSCIRDACKQDD